MLLTSTPLNGARAAIVQDLYRLAFCRQLTATGSASGDRPTSESWQLCDQAIDALLQDYAAMLQRTDRQADAELLMTLLSEMASAPSPR